MDRSHSWAKAALLIMMVLVGGVYLSAAFQPMEWLTGYAADDYFYYLEIAKHITLGEGASFDGVIVTNGFHPLWMALLTALLTLTGYDATLVPQLGLALLSLITLGGGALIFKALNHGSGPLTALTAASLYLLSPWVLLITLAGTESALSSACLALVLLIATRHREVPNTKLLPYGLTLGAAMGLACLGRTDSVLFCIAAAVWILPWALKERGPKATVKTGGAIALAGLVVLAPWLIWNLATFGRISQDSARAIGVLRKLTFFQTHEASEMTGPIWRALTAMTSLLGEMVGLPGFLVIAGLIGVMLGAGRMAQRGWISGGEAFVLRVCATHVLLVLGVYSSYLWFYQYWYFMGPLMSSAVICGILLNRGLALALKGRNKALAPALALGVALLIGMRVTTAWPLLTGGTYSWQRVYHSLAVELDTRLPGATVGAFNSGIYGWFSEIRVVNLDGVVNGEVFEAMEEGRLLAYIKGEEIDFVLDHIDAFNYHSAYAEEAYKQAFTLKYRVPSGSSGGDIVLLGVKGQAK